MDAPHSPITCTLESHQAAHQALEWVKLRSLATSTTRSSSGARLAFPLEHRAAVVDLVERESACCTFLDIAVAIEEGSLIVDITSSNPAARPVIALLGGLDRG